jgi:hypothetical protein
MDAATRIRQAEVTLAVFTDRTGITGPDGAERRYLWTDAFAVRTLLALHRLTGNPRHLASAIRLVDLVHQVLGRHREDEDRVGWISGLSLEDGRRHPTRGGLRIGKPLPERGPGDTLDERLEWDRDGQYFHYLTRWMEALAHLARITGDVEVLRQAIELARAAWCGFVRRTPRGDLVIHWKMSIDLSRPLVASMGHHDPLDGLAAMTAIEATRRWLEADDLPDLEAERTGLLGMCVGRSWACGDELGLGGMLSAASVLVDAVSEGILVNGHLVEEVLTDAVHGLRMLAGLHHAANPPHRRLPFRELGLAIGLSAMDAVPTAVERCPGRFVDHTSILTRAREIAVYAPMAEAIRRDWLDPVNRRSPTWRDHEDINTVMLAASLLPEPGVGSLTDPWNGSDAAGDEAAPAAGERRRW